MNPPLLAATGVVRRFGRDRVLDGLDLSVAAGARLAVLGDNGAGKTTLLRLCAGLLRPDSGRITLFGSEPTTPAVRARLGWLGHVPALYERLTAAENVRFWSGLAGRGPGTGLASLERLGVDPSDPRRVGAFSQGMRRRVGLACALAHEPEILMLDEPFAGLDAAGAAAIAALLADGGRTLLVATHEPDRAAAFCDGALLLRRGRLEPVG